MKMIIKTYKGRNVVFRNVITWSIELNKDTGRYLGYSIKIEGKKAPSSRTFYIDPDNVARVIIKD
jgi:hypothetical protein